VFKFIERVIVRVPHRISGFFEIVDSIDGKRILDPMKIGSRGAGFNVNAFGKTLISYEKIEKDEKSKCSIFINEQKMNEKAETSYYIFNSVKEYIKCNVRLKIEHFFDLPVGCGYGASGSGALGTIFGLNTLFNLNLSSFECGKIAHIAEVINKTGLGTVCGQLGGGLCILKEPGYPCKTEQINVPKNVIIMCVSLGKIQTKAILSDPLLSTNIKKAGKIALKKINSNPNYKNFIKCSIDFVKKSNILEVLNLNEIKELMDELNSLKIIGASMNQLGQSVYIFCKEDKINLVNEILSKFNSKFKNYLLRIYNNKSICIEKS
jgi:pantoate kinase